VQVDEPLNVDLFLAALVPLERLATLKNRPAAFLQGPRKIANFADSPGRLPVGAEQVVKVLEEKMASQRPRRGKRPAEHLDT